MDPSSGNDINMSTEADRSREADRLVQTQAAQDRNQPSAASLDSSVNGPPGLLPENFKTFNNALRMGLPRHLVLRAFKNRTRTGGSPHLSLKDLVTELFSPQTEDQEVPMMTEQLEEGLMLRCYTARQALKMGAPLRLVKSLLRAKILSTGTGYTHTYQLIADVNKLRK